MLSILAAMDRCLTVNDFVALHDAANCCNVENRKTVAEIRGRRLAVVGQN